MHGAVFLHTRQAYFQINLDLNGVSDYAQHRHIPVVSTDSRQQMKLIRILKVKSILLQKIMYTSRATRWFCAGLNARFHSVVP